MERYYNEAIRQITTPKIKENSNVNKRFDCVFSDTPMHTFVRWFVHTFGMGVIVSEELGSKTININLRMATPEEIIALAARTLSVDTAKIGSTFYIGKIKKTDTAVLVRKVTRLSKDSIHNILRNLMSENGTISVLDNGIAVVTEMPETLAKIEQTIIELEAITQECWVLQFSINSSSDTLSKLSGIDATAQDVGISAIINSNSSGQSMALDFNANLSAIIKNAESKGIMRSIHAPLIIAMDGSPVSMHSGKTYRYALSTTSIDKGISQQNELREINDGLVLKVLIRDSGESQAVLDLEFALSSVVAWQNNLPNTATREIKTSCNIASGGLYLVAKIEHETAMNDSSKGIVKRLTQKDATQDNIYIFARCYKISGLSTSVEEVISNGLHR